MVRGLNRWSKTWSKKCGLTGGPKRGLKCGVRKVWSKTWSKTWSKMWRKGRRADGEFARVPFFSRKIARAGRRKTAESLVKSRGKGAQIAKKSAARRTLGFRALWLLGTRGARIKRPLDFEGGPCGRQTAAKRPSAASAALPERSRALRACVGGGGLQGGAAPQAVVPKVSRGFNAMYRGEFLLRGAPAPVAPPSLPKRSRECAEAPTGARRRGPGPARRRRQNGGVTLRVPRVPGGAPPPLPRA